MLVVIFNNGQYIHNERIIGGQVVKDESLPYIV